MALSLIAMLPTPDTSHLRHYPDVYEPAEDTFLFLDALQLEREYLAANRPLICAEIGSVRLLFRRAARMPSTNTMHARATQTR